MSQTAQGADSCSTYRTNCPGDEAHPRSLAVAERRILPVLDAWLARLFDPDHIEETVDTLLRADRPADNDPPPLIEARRLASDAVTRLARHVAAIDAGVDPSILVAQTREAQVDLARANAIIAGDPVRAEIDNALPLAMGAIVSEVSALGFPITLWYLQLGTYPKGSRIAHEEWEVRSVGEA